MAKFPLFFAGHEGVGALKIHFKGVSRVPQSLNPRTARNSKSAIMHLVQVTGWSHKILTNKLSKWY